MQKTLKVKGKKYKVLEDVTLQTTYVTGDGGYHLREDFVNTVKSFKLTCGPRDIVTDLKGQTFVVTMRLNKRNPLGPLTEITVLKVSEIKHDANTILYKA